MCGSRPLLFLFRSGNAKLPFREWNGRCPVRSFNDTVKWHPGWLFYGPTTFTFCCFHCFVITFFSAVSHEASMTHIPDIGSMRLYVLFFMLLLFLVFVKYILDKGKLCFGPPHKSTAIISDWVFMSVVCKCGDISMTNTCQMLLHDGWHRWYNTSCLLWFKNQSHWCSPYSRRRSTKRSENICWFTVFVNWWNWSNFIEIQNKKLQQTAKNTFGPRTHKCPWWFFHQNSN